MRIEKTIQYKRRMGFLDNIQYFLALIIALLFLLGFIPLTYTGFYIIILFAIALQILLSIARLRIINVILELILLFLSVVSLIPLLGYFFRFLGIIATLLDMASFKNYRLYKTIEIKTFKPGKNKPKQKKPSKIKNSSKVREAKFEEKEE